MTIQRITRRNGKAEWHEYRCDGTVCDHGLLVGCRGATTIIGQKDKGFFFANWLKRQGVIAALRVVDTLPTMLSTMNEDAVVKALASAADKTRDDAAGTGTRIHSAVEHWANGEKVADCTRHDPPCPSDIEDIRPELEAFHRFQRAHKAKVERSEFMVISHEHEYGATGDLAWRLWPCSGGCKHIPPMTGGDLRIDDIKTGYVADTVAFQIAAIRFADHDENGDPPPQASQFGVLSLRDGECRLVSFDVRPDTEYRGFLACRYLAEWDKTRAKHVKTELEAA